MIRHYVLAGAAAVALLVVAAPLQRAGAVPLPQTGIEKADGAKTLVRRRGRGFRGRGFRGRSFRGPGRGFRGPRFHGRHYGRRFRPRFRPRYRAYPRSFYYYRGGYLPYAYYYDDYYDGPCEGLSRKAERTGRRYWWTRYRRCLRAYD